MKIKLVRPMKSDSIFIERYPKGYVLFRRIMIVTK